MDRISYDEGAFEITSLPGQCQVAVCHSFFVHEQQRGIGNAHYLKRMQHNALLRANYDFAICTVAAGNAAQKAALTKAGWKKLAEFRNSRQSETTELWGMEVMPPRIDTEKERQATDLAVQAGITPDKREAA